jgi:hypothetical protein
VVGYLTSRGKRVLNLAPFRSDLFIRFIFIFCIYHPCPCRKFRPSTSFGLSGMSIAKSLTPRDSRIGNRQMTGKLKC